MSINLGAPVMTVEAPHAISEILLLADKENEVAIVKDSARSNRVHLVEVCPAVLAFLRREPGFIDSPLPDLILLNIDLSDASHCDTLRQIKEDPRLRRIPVIVLGSSENPAAIRDAYNLNANAYIVKPASMTDFAQAIRATLNFWLNLVRLPRD